MEQNKTVSHTTNKRMLKDDILHKRENAGRYIFILLWLCYIAASIIRNLHYSISDLTYVNCGVSDWLINYQAGFVRRGLPGQVLYMIYQAHPFDVPQAVLAIVAVTSVLLVALMVRIFIKKGWSAAILPLGCCFFFIFLSTSQRKDSLLLLLTYCIFAVYKRYLHSRRLGTWLIFFALSTVMLLSHEASFFFCFPILAVYAYRYNVSHHEATTGAGTSMKARLAKTLMPMAPVALVMGAVCVCKGNMPTAVAIWHSWSDAFAQFPDGIHNYAYTLGNIGDNVEALSWKLLSTARLHLTVNLFGVLEVADGPWNILIGLPGLVVLFGFTYYLVTRLNTVKIGKYKMAGDTAMEISNTLLLQFVFMLPMFTILSCDYGRTIPYWVLSTLMAVACFGRLEITALDKLSGKIQHKLQRPVYKSAWFYTLIVVFTPLTSMYAPIPQNVLQYKALEAVVQHLIAAL